MYKVPAKKLMQKKLIILWIPKDLLALYFSVELFAFNSNSTQTFSLFESVPQFFSFISLLDLLDLYINRLSVLVFYFWPAFPTL